MWRDFISEFAQTAPERTAVIDRITGRRYSYAELESEIRLWASHLHARGVSAGSRVVILAPNRLEHITLFFACAKIGAILVPLNHRLAPGEMAEILLRVEPGYFLGAGPCPFESPFAYRDLDEIDLTADRDEDKPPGVTVADEDPLLMLFTSGSTGTPKGVLLHAGMLMANIKFTVDAGVLEPGEISIVNTPFFHTGGYNVFCLPLLSIGGTLILFEGFDPGGVLEAIREEGVSVFWAVPTMFQAIYEHPDFGKTDFSNIRFFLSGGAPLSLDLIQAYQKQGVPFKQGFGLTEVGPNCFLHETRDSFGRPDSIGKPMAHSRVKVVDRDGREVGPDQVGELLIAGPHVCKGYWRDEARFRDSLRDGFFATGDLVRRDSEGFFYVVGRLKDMYISGGENVYPGEVEKQIVAHPDITQAVVVAVPDRKWTEVGFAFFVGPTDFTLPEIRAWLDSRLARYKHPHHVRRLEALPLLANGKIDRQALKTEALRYAVQ